jgi:hypothetical protein
MRLSNGTGRCNDSAPRRLNFAVRMGSLQIAKRPASSSIEYSADAGVSPRIELENILMSTLVSSPIANSSLNVRRA